MPVLDGDDPLGELLALRRKQEARANNAVKIVARWPKNCAGCRAPISVGSPCWFFPEERPKKLGCLSCGPTALQRGDR